MSDAEAHSLIFDALATRAEELAADMGLEVEMPNRNFEPPRAGGAVAPYLSVSFQPNTSDLDGLPFDGDVTHIGLLQVSVFWPSDKGMVKPLRAAGRVAGGFPAGLRLSHAGYVVNVDGAPTVAAGVQESDRVQVPVTIRWRASLEDE